MCWYKWSMIGIKELIIPMGINKELKKAPIVATIITLFLGVGLFAVIFTIRNISRVVTQSAVTELESTAQQQVSLVNQEISRQFTQLEVLSAYLENEDFTSAESQSTMAAVASVNRWCTIAYADLDGNAVNYKGEEIGDVADRAYFTDIVEGKTTQAVQYLATTLKVNEPRFIFSLPVYRDGEMAGVLFASKEVSILEPILLDNNTSDTYMGILLVSSDGTIISSNKIAKTFLSGDNYFATHFGVTSDLSKDDLLASMQSSDSGFFQYRDGTIENIYYLPTGISDWYLFAEVSQVESEARYQSNISSIINNVFWIIIAFCALLILVCILFFTYIRNVRITEDILRQKKIDELTNELKETQIKNSISQMQPHFLYNSLASIREIMLEDPEYASELICDFTTHLRACIRSMTQNELVPFQTELENIKAYVNIEQMRFGEKLQIHYDIAWDDFNIVPLSIQPLVENAIRHGIYPKGSRCGNVWISTCKTEDSYLIRVRDDGVGFDYESVRREIQEGQRDSTGLQNLIFRLENILGAQVTVESTPGEGTEITVELPVGQNPGTSAELPVGQTPGTSAELPVGQNPEISAELPAEQPKHS